MSTPQSTSARGARSLPPWHRTKIVCTLGPATDAPGVLLRLLEAGMDVARVNTSHGEHAVHARRIQQVRQAADQSGTPVAVLVDLPGPKFRLGDLPEGSRELCMGSAVVLTAEVEKPAAGELPVRQTELLELLRCGESVYLADGSVKLDVQSVHARRVICVVLAAGTVRSGGGINLPDSSFPALIPTADDRRHLAFAVSQQADWVGVSFVQTAGDLERVRALLPPGPQPRLMAKIEKRQALDELDAIVSAADGVMVARGDLGVETDLAGIALVQKRIIALANGRGCPVITATQMLESMVEQEQPTRAEVTDVANAVLDGTDAVMLSAETAIGRFPVAAAAILQRVLAATESGYASQMALDRLQTNAPVAAEDSISFVACQLAARLNARAIVAPVRDMTAALEIARYRPQPPLIAVTDREHLCRQLALVRGVVPLLADAGGPDACAELAQRWLWSHRLARGGDAIVLLCASASSPDRADTLRIVHLPAEPFGQASPAST